MDILKYILAAGISGVITAVFIFGFCMCAIIWSELIMYVWKVLQ
jgi:hypothetical protein